MKDDFKIPSRTVFTDESLNTIFMNQGYVVIRDFVSPSSCKTLNQWYEKNPPERSSGFHASIHSTNVTSTIYLPLSKLKNNPSIEKFFSNTCIKFNIEIFNEDKDICESINSNVKNNNSRKDIIGNLEYRINSFRKKLNKI